MDIEATIRNDATVLRLEMAIKRKEYTKRRAVHDRRFLHPQMTTFLVIRVHEHGVHDNIMSLEASPASPRSIDRMRRFIESTRFRILYLNISTWGEFSDEFGSLIATALLRPDLQTVEIPVEHDIPVGFMDLLVQEDVVKNASWCELALVNHVVNHNQAQVELAISRLFSSEPPAFVYGRIEQHIPALSVKLAKKITRLLRLGENIETLRLDAVRVPIETLVPHRRDDAARHLANGIRTAKSLNRVAFGGTRMRVEAQDLLAQSICQNEAITECHVEGAYGGNDLLSIVENLIPNGRVQCGKISSFQDPRAFDIIGSVLRTRACIAELHVALVGVSPNRVPSHEMDGFINALVASDKLIIGSFRLDGHVNLTKKQWKTLWKAFRRIDCRSVAIFNCNMPEDWEHDFVAELPKMPFKNIHIGTNKDFDTDIVGFDLVFSALKKNYTVETFFLDVDDLHETGRENDWHLLGYLNWAGRRVELLEPNTFNPALWPVILQRINGTNFEDKIHVYDFECGKADVVFYFLRGPLLEVLSRKLSDIHPKEGPRSKKRRLSNVQSAQKAKRLKGPQRETRK
jgi:hypothetical protein